MIRVIDLKVHGICERIPEGNLHDKTFAEWCRTNQIIPLYNKERRGYDAKREVYIDDADYMITLDEKGCGARIYMTEADFKRYELGQVQEPLARLQELVDNTYPEIDRMKFQPHLDALAELFGTSYEFTPKPGPTHEITLTTTTVEKLIGVGK